MSAAEYAATAARLPALARRARLTLAGFVCCIDRTLQLAEVAAPLLRHPDARAAAFGRELQRRAAAGIGGELCIDWPGGPAWLDRYCTAPATLGGTAAQAANALAMLGAPVLLALQDRSATQLAPIHPDVLVATPAGRARVSTLVPGDGTAAKPAHYIFEYAKDERIAGVVAPRSTRVIVRFADESMDDDPAFVAESIAAASTAGTGILAGFNSVPPPLLAGALEATLRVADAWRAAGLHCVHLELGDFPNPETRQKTLAALRGRVTSLGMNNNELHGLVPGEAPVDAKALALAERMAVDRVSVHADDWALSLTRGDAARERDALLAGCLLAATRAAAGRLAVPAGPPAEAVYRPPPSPGIALPHGWHIASCAAPYLSHPRSTLGLGDTFLAGTMLVLGQPGPASRPLHPLATTEG